jgi:predicted RND superfamily exporter protein
MEKMLARPGLMVMIILGITLFFGLQLGKIELDNNNYRFVPETDDARQTSAYIDETFGSSSFILVGLERKYGTVLDQEFLNRIREYVDRISRLNHVEEIHSLISSDYITGDSETILAEKLAGENFTGTQEDLSALKKRLLSWDMYRRALISDDFTATQILIPLDITAENAGHPEVVDSFLQIRDLAKEMFAGIAKVYVTGLPVISATINEAVKADLAFLVPLVILVVVAVVFLPLRRLSFVALSLLPVIIAVIWSIGAMPLFGVKLSIISTVLPVILIAVGSSYGLHVIIHYIEDSAADFGLMTKDQHRTYIAGMMRSILKALLLAAVTTTVSFLSFCFTKVLPIREFGFFAGFGVMASFLITLFLIPGILVIRGPKALQNIKRKKSENNESLGNFFSSIVKKKKLVLLSGAVLGGLALFGASKIVIDNIFVEYFKPSTDIYQSEGFIRKQFGGSKVLSIVVKAETPEILLHPGTLTALDSLNTYLMERVPEVGKTMSFTDLVKRINQVFNADASAEGLPKTDPADSGFGFGDFGFSFEETPEPLPEKVPALPEPAYTPQELGALLDKAVNSMKTPGDADSAALVWEIKKLINYEGAGYYEIPQDPARYGKQSPEELQALVSNYLLLLSGNLGSYANDPLEPTAIKTTVQLRTFGQRDTDRAVAEIRGFVEANFPKNLEVLIGGAALVEASLNSLVVQSLWTSMVIALVFLFCIIAVCHRSLLAGLISLGPLVLLILITFAVMGFGGIKLNIGTAMIASLSLGIGIDYTIHYIEAFRREYRANSGDFLKETYRTCGLAIIVDALATGAGFGVLLFSQFNMLAELGLLIMLAMIMSALVGLIIIPALLMLVKPAFIYRK